VREGRRGDEVKRTKRSGTKGSARPVPSFVCANEKRPARGPASMRVAGGGSHDPAGEAGSALTWRAETLVLAPQEHPEEMGLGSKREARTRVEPT
jgi:hypothetical protein